MTQSDSKSSPEAGRSLVVRWRILAQKRLDHLVELYESGRWKLYYDEPEFLAMIQETRSALKVWHELAPLDPQFDQPAGIAPSEVLDDSPPLLPSVLVNQVAVEHELRKA
ncbi:MAG: TIGR03809 family protein [Afipia sp.]|nr:TIGR03809 family protein [Afipia sp.]OJW66112.1 MAG: TIGR03809 family protein [Afipia sp. 64-13]